MTKKTSHPLGIGQWSKWKQIAFFFVALALSMGALEYYKSTQRGSPQAQSIKSYLKPIAAQLDKAQELGDYQAAIALLEPAGKVISDYNELDESKKAAINSTALRYCMLASTHLLSGAIEVSKQGQWTNKSVYEAALNACK